MKFLTFNFSEFTWKTVLFYLICCLILFCAGWATANIIFRIKKIFKKEQETSLSETESVEEPIEEENLLYTDEEEDLSETSHVSDRIPDSEAYAEYKAGNICDIDVTDDAYDAYDK
ncbi:MAG: hypothetical protein K6B28_07710 [Lachnospiraceae bacterium]|nr:hypothetical protein [Lachnospiraceae bacterium]